MPRRQTHIEGGKVKSLKRIGRDINKGFDKTTRGLAKAGAELGKFTNEQLLPAVVSAGIPLASTALGVVGQEFGLPPELTSSLSENLMKGYIPKQYQSDNKYVNLFGDALNMAVSGDADPYAMAQLQQGLIGAVSEDIAGKPKMKTPLPSRQAYNPDNPYQDLMLQMMMNYMPIDQQIPSNIPQTVQQPIDTNPNDDLDARYGDSELGEGADSLRITRPPYQQREGNVDALLGGGMKKKRRGRPRKIVIEEDIEIYTKKKPAYKKFSHAKNTALDQLLEAKEERESKEAKKAMKEMVEKQTRALTALGFGLEKINENPSEDDYDIIRKVNIKIGEIYRNPSLSNAEKQRQINQLETVKSRAEDRYHRKKSGMDIYGKPVKDKVTDKMEGLGFKKGSKEAKEHMARLRAMRKK